MLILCNQIWLIDNRWRLIIKRHTTIVDKYNFYIYKKRYDKNLPYQLMVSHKISIRFQKYPEMEDTMHG